MTRGVLLPCILLYIIVHSLYFIVYNNIIVRSLECWQCDTFDDSGGCNELNKTASQCKSFEDACIKIVTEFESPHSGPRNRTAEKEQKSREDNFLRC